MCSRHGDTGQHVPSPAERGDARGPQEAARRLHFSWRLVWGHVLQRVTG